MAGRRESTTEGDVDVRECECECECRLGLEMSVGQKGLQVKLGSWHQGGVSGPMAR